MGWLRTLVVLACCLGVVGCSDDSPGPEPGPSPTGSVSTPSPSSSSSAPEPAPREPALPGAAKQATERGARAFIAYYWDLINYAQVTGDVRALKRVSGPNCDGCNGGIRAITEVYENGGRAEGGEYSVEVVEVKPAHFKDKRAHAYEGTVRVRNAEQLITHSDGTTKTLAATDNLITVYLLWVRSSWRLDVLVVE